MKEHDTRTVPVDGLADAIKALIREGWDVTGYGFAPEGASHTTLVLQRDCESKPAAKPAAKPKPKRSPK